MTISSLWGGLIWPIVLICQTKFQLLASISCWIFTKLRESNGFSCVYLSTGRGGLMWPLPMIYWTSQYRDSPLYRTQPAFNSGPLQATHGHVHTVELGPHCRRTPPDILNVLIMKRLQLASGRLASYLNTLLLPPATKLGQGYVFTRVCDSVHRGEGYPSMHCRWYPSIPCNRSPGGSYPSMPCRFPGSHPGGTLSGLAGGRSPGSHLGGISRPKLGGVSRATPKGRCVSQHALTATAAGGTHPTGMHSCYCLFSAATTTAAPQPSNVARRSELSKLFKRP